LILEPHYSTGCIYIVPQVQVNADNVSHTEIYTMVSGLNAAHANQK